MIRAWEHCSYFVLGVSCNNQKDRKQFRYRVYNSQKDLKQWVSIFQEHFRQTSIRTGSLEVNLWIFGVKVEKVSDWNFNRHIFTEIESTVNNITVLCHYRTFIDAQNFRSKSYGTIPRQGKNFKKVFALSYEIIFLSVLALVDESSFRLEISLCKFIDLMRKSFQNLNNIY